MRREGPSVLSALGKCGGSVNRARRGRGSEVGGRWVSDGRRQSGGDGRRGRSRRIRDRRGARVNVTGDVADDPGAGREAGQGRRRRGSTGRRRYRRTARPGSARGDVLQGFPPPPPPPPPPRKRRPRGAAAARPYTSAARSRLPKVSRESTSLAGFGEGHPGWSLTQRNAKARDAKVSQSAARSSAPARPRSAPPAQGSKSIANRMLVAETPPDGMARTCAQAPQLQSAAARRPDPPARARSAALEDAEHPESSANRRPAGRVASHATSPRGVCTRAPVDRGADGRPHYRRNARSRTSNVPEADGDRTRNGGLFGRPVGHRASGPSAWSAGVRGQRAIQAAAYEQPLIRAPGAALPAAGAERHRALRGVPPGPRARPATGRASA